MSHDLRSCTHCARHIRVTETTCPFCAAPVSLERQSPSRVGGTSARLRRAFALSALATTAAAAAPGCGGATETPPPVITGADAYGAVEMSDAGDSSIMTGAAYGAVEVPDAGQETEPDADAAPDVVTGVAAYGGPQPPPVDAGSEADASDSDH